MKGAVILTVCKQLKYTIDGPLTGVVVYNADGHIIRDMLQSSKMRSDTPDSSIILVNESPDEKLSQTMPLHC